MPETLHTDTLIVGTGFAGLCAAIQLKEAGFEDLVLLERGDSVGGTWRDNHYPGCACDVQSHLYSFSFEPNPTWSRMFAPQPEILRYLKGCADKYDVRRHVRFNRNVTSMAWDDDSGTWTVRTDHGETWTANNVISAIGGLSTPAIPDIDGLDDFAGPVFHSADWDHDLDLSGKRVAVIGTGASAIQFVPQIAPKVESLALFQRTPPWIVPKPDRAISTAEQALFKRVPAVQQAARSAIYAQLESRAAGFVLNPRLLKLGERMARSHIRKQIPDRKLRRKVTPDYSLGCKRVLVSNDYYPALARDNVDVVTDGITKLTKTGVRTADGALHKVDVVILGTGFEAQKPFGRGMLVGRGGQDIWDAWSDRLSAYYGMSIAGFPNFYLLTGPNSGLGHNSMVYMIESQVNMVVDALYRKRRHGWRSIEVTPQAQAECQAAIDAKSAASVWSGGGCKSWYLDEQGRNTTLWPDFTFKFRDKTRRLNAAHFRIVKANGEVMQPRRGSVRKQLVNIAGNLIGGRSGPQVAA